MEEALASSAGTEGSLVKCVSRVEELVMEPVQRHVQTYDIAKPFARQCDDCCFVAVRRDLCFEAPQSVET
jgi:hypothetical protein